MIQFHYNWFEFDTVGEEIIRTQLVKLSEETRKVPEEQLVSEVFVETEVVSIGFVKVTEIDDWIETEVSESEGEVDETVGGVESVVVVLSVVVLSVVVLESSLYSSLSSPQEMMVRLNNQIRKMKKNFFIFTLTPKIKYYWLREPYVYHNLGVIYKNVGILLGSVWRKV